MREVCLDCLQPFQISKTEVEWFEERNMTLPKRCAGCRRRARAERLTRALEYGARRHLRGAL